MPFARFQRPAAEPQIRSMIAKEFYSDRIAVGDERSTITYLHACREMLRAILSLIIKYT